MFVIFLFSLITNVQAKTIKVAILDTGLGYTLESQKAKLCKHGHKDFTDEQQFMVSTKTVDKVPLDSSGHGTNIAGIISRFAKKPYCLVIIKIYSKNSKLDYKASIDAIKYAKTIRADIVNYSGGGEGEMFEETLAVKEYLDSGGTFVAAAGNANKDLSKSPFYPGCSDNRVIVVGNISMHGKKSFSSNFGTRINRWEIGENIEGFGIYSSGTSQSTAIVTGKKINEL